MGPEAVWCCQHNTTHAWDKCWYILSDSLPNVSDGPVACLTDRPFVHGFRRTLHRDGGHSTVTVDTLSVHGLVKIILSL